MVFGLTEDQEQFFKTVLMYISNERKSALIQVLDSKEAKTVIQISRELYHVSKQNVGSIFNRVLSPLELAVEETVLGERGKDAKAFRLTEKGEQVKRYAGFALEIMAREFNQSIYPILGTMNSPPGDKVRPQQAVALLYLINQAPISLKELIEHPSLTARYNVTSMLNDLSSFKDTNGNPIPLIRITSPELYGGIKGYRWVKDSVIPTIGKSTKRWKKLVKTLELSPGRMWTEYELAIECGYDGIVDLNSSLSFLESKGNLKSGFSTELAQACITTDGRRMLYSLFEPIRGAIAGNPASIGVIDQNQPTPANVAKVLGCYVAIKNLERSGQPVLSQMQQM